MAAQAATSTIPIVFTGEDPVSAGLVASFNQPGGNATGVSTLTVDIGSKRFGLLRELVPKATTIALLLNPKYPGGEQHLQDVQRAARSLGQQVHVLNAANEEEIDSAFAAIARERPDALLLNPDPFLNSRRDQIVALANYHRIPALMVGARLRRPAVWRATDQATQSLTAWSASTRVAYSKVPSRPICQSSSPRSSSW
jgi:putative ABC transport system substrate-binding protein